jgi:DNA-binding response OmpR family regulator
VESAAAPNTQTPKNQRDTKRHQIRMAIIKQIAMEQVKNFKIFLTDDDPFNLNFSQRHLNSLGYADITAYTNGTDCLNNLNLKPDIIFLDHMMDDISGFEVLKKIKRFDPNIFVVMLSAQDSMMTAIDALKYGAFDYIIKGENSLARISEVMARITAVQEMMEITKPSFWKKISTIL